METYGVSFDGFQPSCGWPMYKHVKDELIPQLRSEVERWRVRRDAAANERSALKGLKSDIDGLVKSRSGLVTKLQATTLPRTISRASFSGSMANRSARSSAATTASSGHLKNLACQNCRIFAILLP